MDLCKRGELTSQIHPMMTLDANAHTPTMVAKVASRPLYCCAAPGYAFRLCKVTYIFVEQPLMVDCTCRAADMNA